MRGRLVAVLVAWSGLAGALGARYAALPGDGAGSPQQRVPTFSRDIAPLLYRECAACHRPGGAAPFSLIEYGEVRERASLIAAATAARRMPPWLPEPSVADFAGQRRLTDAEVATIQAWVAAGAPQGDPADLPPTPRFPNGWQLGTPDLVIAFPAYRVPAGGGDIYRNLVVSVPVAEVRYVRAVELRPGSPGVVHHARLMVDTTSSSRALDAEDPEPGFDGMDLLSAADNPAGFFLGWTPGRNPSPEPLDLAWRLAPGTDLVLQLHLRPSGRPQEVQAEVGLYFASMPPARRPALIMLGSKEIDIPAGERNYEITDSYRLPADVDVLSLYPHAHYLATRMEAFARLPGGKTRWLLRIPQWDFNWQDQYRYREPVFLPRGSVITMRYVYDNSDRNPRNPSHPARRVRYGPNSTDEMADLVLQVLPRRGEDLEPMERELAWKYQAANAAWVASREWARGNLLVARGEAEEAIAHYRTALSNVASPEVHAALAGALAGQGDFEGAMLQAREALRRAPQAALSLAAMARVLAQHPDPGIRNAEEAQRLADRVLEAAGPGDALALVLAADVFEALGRTNRAQRAAARAAELAKRAGQEELARTIERRFVVRR
jgi:tetratricopeptide (TPR) repeat protein/mono/diheme cytochrome c family protein